MEAIFYLVKLSHFFKDLLAVWNWIQRRYKLDGEIYTDFFDIR